MATQVRVPLTHAIAAALGTACGEDDCFNVPAAYSQVCESHRQRRPESTLERLHRERSFPAKDYTGHDAL